MNVDQIAVETSGVIQQGIENRTARSLTQLATQCLDEARNDRETAVVLFCELIEVHKELHDEFVRQAARYFIRQRQSNIRDVVQNMNPDDTSGLPDLGRITRTWLNDWTLPTGHRLGDADIGVLTKSLAQYQADAAGALRNARFVKKIAAKLKPNKTVRQSMNEAAIASIWKSLK